MRQSLPRVPKDRIAVLIGAKGATAKSLHQAAGCKEFNIDSDTGDVEVLWGEPGTYDPVKAMKLPDVIKAIARGMAPKAAIRLLQDDHFFELVDLRDYVGKRANQQRRIRARIIGSEGKIRKLIEGLTNTEITIYKSTVVLVGHEEGLAAARTGIEMIAGGAEHGTVLNFLEKDRRRSKLASRSLDSIEIKSEEIIETGFENLVPGLADLSERRNRRMRASQIDPEDAEAVEFVMELADDENIVYSEEE
ncbi:MAG: RNA-processing protein [Euryarchaeota archaeon]|jgi:ribosomal RNA assembly protein|nr:RNA-processing protein [Euryarchaeota archaeon]MBT5254529.1 RNA-processing protein [Euryarchaeota archaeon]MDG1546901.1 KH domain-containing protein [Candidatus Poseidoniaceae archaeon]